ncbi:MAG TPA: aromatic acid exporter family protein [Nocardiopsis listeri]|uniref:FUSC family protein n=1 Tax=Nocardiopsis listeri TaxID=53440 RepID=UPI001D74FF20|nr:aromatic acid exporter family protein [Nocardiopsis listeri]HJE58279.1 aromatic acid exporter family protein [Nocardiopsis listeri]
MAQGRWDRLKRGIDRAYRRRGFERETAVLILKCAIAATLAYVVGRLLGGSTQIGFAPFTALLVVRPSVYGSVLQSGRYVAAVFAGALMAGGSGLTLGPTVWVFALVVLVALIIGQARFFGEQGTQVSVVAAFALAGGTATKVPDLGSLLLMVCVGAGCALLTNLVLAPAVRFRDAENAVLDFSDSLRSLTGEIAEGLRRGKDGLDMDHWGQAADGLDGTVDNALESIHRQEDRLRFNPRRFLVRERTSTEQLDIYRDWIQAMSRSSQHVQSLIRTLRTTTRSGSRFTAPDDAFLRELAPLLERASEIFRAVHEKEEPARSVVSDDLSEMVDDVLSRLDGMRERGRREWDDERWPVYSALLTDVERLLEEIAQGYENIERSDDR